VLERSQSMHRSVFLLIVFEWVQISFAGRAIRHKGDWASLILLDQRYASGTIRAKLPKWIGSRLLVAETFGQAMKELGSFYRNKRAI